MLNEAVIRRVVGGASAMRKQLDHITEMAKLPHVNVQVLPFSAGVHPAMEGAFRILGFPESADPDVVYPGVILRYLMGSAAAHGAALLPADCASVFGCFFNQGG